jgi:small subunit ribosomal protein S21
LRKYSGNFKLWKRSGEEGGVKFLMPEVRVRKDESIEKALRRFKKLCNKESLIKEMKRRRSYVKPSQKRREKLGKSRNSRS